MKGLIFTLLILLYSTTLFAIKGEYRTPNPKVCCKLRALKKVFNSETGKHEERFYTCSATLVGQERLLTAEHCLPQLKKSEATIECPNGQKIAVKNSIKLPSDSLPSWQDLGVVTVKEAFNTPAIEILKDPQKFYQLQAQNFSSCFISGYGLDNEGNYGQQLSANIKRAEYDRLFIGKNKVRLYENHADHGDSGGSMICQVDGQEYLVGVPQGGTKGLPFSNIELLGQATPWLEYITGEHFPQDNDRFRKIYHMGRRCTYLKSNCEDLQKTEKLSRQVIKVLKEIDELISETSEVIEQDTASLQELNSLDEQLRHHIINNCQ